MSRLHVTVMQKWSFPVILNRITVTLSVKTIAIWLFRTYIVYILCRYHFYSVGDNHSRLENIFSRFVLKYHKIWKILWRHLVSLRGNDRKKRFAIEQSNSNQLFSVAFCELKSTIVIHTPLQSCSLNLGPHSGVAFGAALCWRSAVPALQPGSGFHLSTIARPPPLHGKAVLLHTSMNHCWIWAVIQHLLICLRYWCPILNHSCF